MTNEDAIEILRKNRPTSDPRPCGMELCDALDMAISALRQQETVAKCNGLNEPLTLDELRQMDGEPVWVQSPGVPEYGRWAIVEGVGENCLFLHDDFTCHEYGKTWLAYRQKPEEDDHGERKENENARR